MWINVTRCPPVSLRMLSSAKEMSCIKRPVRMRPMRSVLDNTHQICLSLRKVGLSLVSSLSE